MPCDTYRLTKEQTLEQRNAQIKKALAELEKKLLASQVKVVISQQGAVAFADWSKADRAGITDVCAYRVLSVQGSWALRQAVAKAEMLAGRKVSTQAVAAGVHSHDGGKTWGSDQ